MSVQTIVTPAARPFAVEFDRSDRCLYVVDTRTGARLLPFECSQGQAAEEEANRLNYAELAVNWGSSPALACDAPAGHPLHIRNGMVSRRAAR